MEQAREAPKKLNVFAGIVLGLNRRHSFADYGLGVARAPEPSRAKWEFG
jgi:hypothetical protein